MAKGSEFERSIAKRLSLWWSHGVSDDLIWRTAGSGGRATMRRRRGQGTVNAAGDLAPTSPEAQPLFKFFTFELKRGYNRVLLSDTVDRPPNSAMAGWDQWHLQATTSMRESGSRMWLLIHKRDKRPEMIYWDYKLAMNCEFINMSQSLRISAGSEGGRCVEARGSVRVGKQTQRSFIAGVPLEVFLSRVSAEEIKQWVLRKEAK